MTEIPVTPTTPAQTLFEAGLLSLRALKVMQQAGLTNPADLAHYHSNDPRYLTLGGCGKKTRHELNAAIKAAFGTLHPRKGQTAPAPQKAAGSWAERWAEAEGGDLLEIAPDSIAAAWEAEGTLTPAERNFYARCQAYRLLISACKGVPSSPDDIKLHQWFLKQRLATLSARRRALFNELCLQIS